MITYLKNKYHPSPSGSTHIQNGPKVMRKCNIVGIYQNRHITYLSFINVARSKGVLSALSLAAGSAPWPMSNSTTWCLQCNTHRCLPVLVSGVGVGTAVQQQSDDVLVAGLRGHVHPAVGRWGSGSVAGCA